MYLIDFFSILLLDLAYCVSRETYYGAGAGGGPRTENLLLIFEVDQSAMSLYPGPEVDSICMYVCQEEKAFP